MTTNTTDFIRPPGIEEGVLLNTNNDALAAYKRAKKRMRKVDILEKQLNELEDKYQKIIQMLERNNG